MNFVGFGKDIHKLSKAKTNIVLGGVKIVSNYKIIAFSDGDIVLHAIANAILGACQNGDIGMLFPDTDKTNKNINSKKILDCALTVVKNKKMKINNLDLTIVCDKIMINSVRNDIKKYLCKLLKTDKVNVKATRFEQNLNLIECNAIILMEKK